MQLTCLGNRGNLEDSIVKMTKLRCWNQEANHWHRLCKMILLENSILDSISLPVNPRLVYTRAIILISVLFCFHNCSFICVSTFSSAYLHVFVLQLLFKLNRPSEVSSRGYSFVISFAKALTLHEVSLYQNSDFADLTNLIFPHLSILS